MSQAEISAAELVTLCATDTVLFEKTFFPKTARVAPALFHPEMNAALDGPNRYLNIEVFRGGAKTTKFRMYAMKRICYGLSKTIVIVGKSLDHAVRTLGWIQTQIETNKLLTETFRLRKGKTWQTDKFQIINEADGSAIWVAAVGISGSVRGINFDDFRPDLILVDDVIDEENATSAEQRLKTEKLVLGAIKHSLISAVEAPLAKMVILQTPIHAEDISQLAKKDPLFKSLRFGCWTHETENLPIDQRESSWPALFPSETLRQERAAAIALNKLSIFSAEMECKLVTVENSKFREEWLQFHGEGEDEPTPAWNEMWVEIVIDPVPPPSEAQLARGLQGKDYEAITAVGKKQGKFYLLETSFNRGHEPSWTISEFFRMCNKWRPKKVLVESVAYQRTLAWLLRKAMQSAGRYWLIEEFVDKRSKYNKILDGITGPASERKLYVNKKDHGEFISQFVTYDKVQHDDVIETVAIALTSLQRGVVGDAEDHNYKLIEAEIEELGDYRGAP